MKKYIKAIFQTIGAVFGISILIFLVIFSINSVVLSFQQLFNLKDDLATITSDALIAIIAACMAGAFTIIGVDRTLNKQGKNDFIKQFPLKIMILDEIDVEIEELKSRINKRNSSFLVLDRNYFQNLFEKSTGVDGYIYYRLRDVHLKFSFIIDEMFFDASTSLFKQDSYGQWLPIEGKFEKEIENKLNELEQLVIDISELIKKYRSDFITYYNDNLESSIYKKIDNYIRK